MKRNLIIYALSMFVLLLNSCQGTWIMYDTSQKDRLYMETTLNTTMASFALISDQEMSHDVTVKLMGMPGDQDREFAVEFIEAAADEKITVAGQEYETYTAVEGVDFEVEPLVFPAGATETVLTFTLKRTETLQTKFAALKFRIVENDEFLPMDQDSTNTDTILSKEYHLYFNDGDPVCPAWWGASEAYPDWQMLVGKFYPEKYRKFLDLYHEMETKCPAIYEQQLAKYGYNLDNEDVESAFFQKNDPAVWATYVLIPLYEHFKAFYDANPDHENAAIDTFKDSGTAGTYWKNPIGQLK